jgi:hypothetical protein
MRNRRLTAGLVAAGLVLAACGGGGGESADDGPAAYGTDDGAPLSATSTAPGTTAKGATATTAKAGTKAGGAATTAAPAATTLPSGRTAPPATTAQVSKEADVGKGAVGSFARRILRPAPAQRIVLELLVQEKVNPTDRSIRHVTKVLGEVSGKPVSTPRVALPSGGDNRYSAAEVIKLADQYGVAPQGGDQAVIRMLVLAGRSDDPNVLGFAIRGDVLAIFPEQLHQAESPLVDFATLEDAVVMHEVGHILGLVDLARKTGREDKEHPGHSTNRGSVMYWAVESSVVGQVLGGPPPIDFDKADLADIAALKDGA